MSARVTAKVLLEIEFEEYFDEKKSLAEIRNEAAEKALETINYMASTVRDHMDGLRFQNIKVLEVLKIKFMDDGG